MGLHVLLQVLWALEALPTLLALVGLERDVNANVRGDVVAFHGGRVAAAPAASEAEVVRGLAAHMALTDVVLLIRLDSHLY